MLKHSLYLILNTHISAYPLLYKSVLGISKNFSNSEGDFIWTCALLDIELVRVICSKYHIIIRSSTELKKLDSNMEYSIIFAEHTYTFMRDTTGLYKVTLHVPPEDYYGKDCA